LDKQDILERLDFYREAPPEVQPTMSAAARYVRLAPGDFLFKEGDAPSEFAAVGAGSIRVFRIGATGREITLYHVRSQQSSLVSMLAVLLTTPVIATGQAEGGVTLFTSHHAFDSRDRERAVQTPISDVSRLHERHPRAARASVALWGSAGYDRAMRAPALESTDRPWTPDRYRPESIAC
jgi:CRP-like cAMP-binding protein